MDWKDFVEAVAASRLEFPQLRAACLAQAILESGRGNSSLSRDFNNYHGMKWRQELAGLATPVEYQTGTEPTGKATFCRFGSAADAVLGYWRFLDRSPYQGWRDHSGNPSDFLGFIGPIWCPPGYARTWKDEHKGLVYHEYIMQELYPEAVRSLQEAAGAEDHTELRKGDRGQAVRDLQRELNELLGARLEVNGEFDEKTEEMVKSVETLLGLEPDGIADADVWKAMQALRPETNDDPGKKTLWIPFSQRLPEIPTQWDYEDGYPKGAVVHFTAGDGNPVDTVKYLGRVGYPCLVMGRDGVIYQAFPLNRGGCHSGTFHHKYSVGIEMVAAGSCRPVIIDGQRRFAPWYALDAHGAVKSPRRCLSESEMRQVAARDGNRYPGWYHKYTPEQESSLIRLLLWLKSQAPDIFSLDHVKGHDECCDEGRRPGAKNDPGGSLSMTMADLRDLLKSRYHGHKSVVIDDREPPTNVRSGPGTGYPIVGRLNNGTPVKVEEDNGRWLRISSPVTGWVAEHLTKIA